MSVLRRGSGALEHGAEHRSLRCASKAEATARMYFLGGRVVEPLGPGSKEKKSALVALGRFVDLDLESTGSKVACGRAIAEIIDVDWSDTCYSAGDTITLYGLNQLLEGAIRWHARQGRGFSQDLLSELESIEPAPLWHQRLEEDSMAFDISEIERNIAEQLAELHELGPVPEGVDAPRYEIHADDIRVDDGSWRTALAAAQGWLHLSGAVDEADAARFDASLADLLSLDGVTPTPVLLSRLLARLEQATALRTAFLAELEDEPEGSATLKTASAHWREGWESLEETEEAETAGPIRASTKVWPITQFRQYASEGALELSPSYQRADVWPTGDAQLLIESILRGIPLPSVILLEKEMEDAARYEIVDGKQRLTAILRFTAAHPKALATVKAKASEWNSDIDETLDLFRRDYPTFRALWRRHERSPLTARFEKDLYFPFPLRSGTVPALSGDLEQARGRYYSEIRNLPIESAGKRRKVSAIFEEHVEYCIPVITYEQVTSHQVHEVFSLYNKQGKHLNAEEIRNAAFHELDFMRALLATAGDSSDVTSVAPFLAENWEKLASTGRNLSDYGITDAGYKRTKALSWVASSLLSFDERLESRSTAAHINNFLKRIQDDKRDPLRSHDRINGAMLLLDAAVDAHVSIDEEVWATRFRNAQGGAKWQELQLVASLIALAAAAAMHGEALADAVDNSLDEISARSEHWTRPRKTQSREQWRYIGAVVRDFLDILEVDGRDADRRLRSEFGTAGLQILLGLPAGD